MNKSIFERLTRAWLRGKSPLLKKAARKVREQRRYFSHVATEEKLSPQRVHIRGLYHSQAVPTIRRANRNSLFRYPDRRRLPKENENPLSYHNRKEDFERFLENQFQKGFPSEPEASPSKLYTRPHPGVFHVGTFQAAEDRAGRNPREFFRNYRLIMGDFTGKVFGPVTDDEANRIADRIGEIQKLRAQGYDAVSYTNTGEDVGSISYVILNPRAFRPRRVFTPRVFKGMHLKNLEGYLKEERRILSRKRIIKRIQARLENSRRAEQALSDVIDDTEMPS